jgi:hypothetical protein
MFPIESGILPVSWLFEKSLYINYIYKVLKDFKFPVLNGMAPFRRL